MKNVQVCPPIVRTCNQIWPQNMNAISFRLMLAQSASHGNESWLTETLAMSTTLCVNTRKYYLQQTLDWHFIKLCTAEGSTMYTLGKVRALIIKAAALATFFMFCRETREWLSDVLFGYCAVHQVEHRCWWLVCCRWPACHWGNSDIKKHKDEMHREIEYRVICDRIGVFLFEDRP